MTVKEEEGSASSPSSSQSDESWQVVPRQQTNSFEATMTAISTTSDLARDHDAAETPQANASRMTPDEAAALGDPSLAPQHPSKVSSTEPTSTAAKTPKSKKAQKWKERLAKKKDPVAKDLSKDDTAKQDKDEDNKQTKEEQDARSEAARAAQRVPQSTSFTESKGKQEQEQQRLLPETKCSPTQSNDKIATSTLDATSAPAPVDSTIKKEKLDLKGSYQEIAKAKRRTEEETQEAAQRQVEAERQAKEAERLQSIVKLEEERQQRILEQEQKARDEEAATNLQRSATSSSPWETTAAATAPHQEISSLVVLISTAFCPPNRRANQDRILAMLQGQGIVHVIVDGSDPQLKDLRNDLFEISGLRGKYPQFFRKTGDDLVFVGDYETFQATVENDTLMHTLKSSSKDPTLETKDTPATSSKMMVVLVSKSFGTAAQKANQERALTALRAQQLPLEEIDGSDPVWKERRNELFDLSGMRGKYPQFFVKDEAGKLTFLGDYEAFESLNETNALDDILDLKRTASAGPTTQPSSELPSTTTDPTLFAKSMVVLVSKSFGTLVQKTNQERALVMLKGKQIPIAEVVDGSDPTRIDQRNELFAISGMRGNYPQFFVKSVNGKEQFLGDFGTFEQLMDSDDALLQLLKASAEETGMDQVTALPSITSDTSPRREPSRSVSSDTLPDEKWENEYETPPTPSRDPVQSRSLSRDSEVTPSENFENEFDEDMEDSNPRARLLSRDSSTLPSESFENEFDEVETAVPAFRQRSLSRDSALIPEEAFENEFEQDDSAEDKSLDCTVSQDSDRMPIELFENEFKHSTVKNTEKDPRRLDSQASSVVPDETFENECPDALGSVKEEEDLLDAGPMKLHIAVGVLGVIVVAGMWFATGQRGQLGHHH